MGTRQGIYYWKCDRPSDQQSSVRNEDYLHLLSKISALVASYLGSTDFSLKSAGGQGNHLIYLVSRNQKNYFIRIENGEDHDDYMCIESGIMKQVKDIGIPVPEIFTVDVSRREYPFVYQIMEYIEYPDLGKILKSTNPDITSLMFMIGRSVAEWQSLEYKGYGPFNSDKYIENGTLIGLHKHYKDYYFLNLEKHLQFLLNSHFLDSERAQSIFKQIKANEKYLDMDQGVLVHKDLALWNILGNDKDIKAFIDWDDCISGDPMDDLSLMACFHPGNWIEKMFEGYTTVKPLPHSYEKRFWLHLLRNMIFKAVIRVKNGYFNKTDDFFLIPSNTNGQSLYHFTQERIDAACLGLKGDKQIIDL